MKTHHFISTQELEERSILILAPHADDEILGCGGLIIKSQESKAILNLVVITQLDETRKHEMKLALDQIGFESIYQLGLPEFWKKKAVDEQKAEQTLFEIVNALQAEFILIPSLKDHHPDHYHTIILLSRVLNATELITYAPKILQYEIFVPHCNPDRFLNISDVIMEKLERIKKYQSQNQRYALFEITAALNTFRGKTFLRKHINSVESYQSISKTTLINHGRQP